MMKWTIEYYSKKVQDWINTMPVGMRAAYARITELLIEFGMDLRLPHSRAMGEGLFELRPKGKEGAVRIFYCVLLGRRIVILHGFVKKTQETPRKELETAMRRMREVKYGQAKK